MLANEDYPDISRMEELKKAITNLIKEFKKLKKKDTKKQLSEIKEKEFKEN